MSEIKPPASRPCGSCPYRRDVPSGVWHPEEYEKLPHYDDMNDPETFDVFLCHQQDGRACAGWTATHDMENSIGIRIACIQGSIEDPRPFWEYQTDVPLFGSGAEAAAHGLSDIERPDADALRVMDKLRRKGLVIE